MIILKLLFVYFLLAVLTYFALSLFVNPKVHDVFDEQEDSASARMMATTFCSLLWPIAWATLIYDFIMEVFKNGRD